MKENAIFYVFLYYSMVLFEKKMLTLHRNWEVGECRKRRAAFLTIPALHL